MNKTLCALALLPVLWQTPACSDPSRVPRVAQEVSAGDAYSVGPLRLADSAEKVLAILGQPQTETEAEFEAATALYTKQWLYPDKGVGVILGGNEKEGPYAVEVLMLEEPSTWSAAAGLSIGMPGAEGQALLRGMIREGVSDFSIPEEDKYGVLFEDTYTVLAIGVVDGVVKHLYLGPGPE